MYFRRLIQAEDNRSKRRLFKSNEYMSMAFAPLPLTDDSRYFQGVWARMFGHFIQSARQKAGRSVEETAALAGMDPAQWLGVEAGDYLPMTCRQLHVVADAVAMERAAMAAVVLLCRQAWEMQ